MSTDAGITLCKHFLVSGRVQGVFYRATTQEIAQRLGLTGWVRNLGDGRVELVACGSHDQLAELEAWLWQGPAYASVEEVQAQEVTTEPCTGFDVRF
ncbi:MAG: acylphosphatase [Gammaproteobacteria bacterium]|nr:MAG: acylphosphatase [Gammaproteobacteria bacterium]